MRPFGAALAACALSLPWLVPAPARAEAGSARGVIDVERAVGLALERGLAVRAAEARAGLARGGLEAARVFGRGRNPELSGGAGVRFGPGGPGPEAELGLSQALDLGRSRPGRLAAARAEVSAAEERLADERLRVVAEVRVAYVEAVVAAEAVRLAAQAEALARRLHLAAEERAAADAATAIEQNLAAIEWAGARRQLAAARRELVEARAELSRLLALPPGEPFEIQDELPARPEAGGPLAPLRARALAGRRDLAALGRDLEAAEARVRLARAEGWPELEIGASYSFEEGTDHVVGVGLSVALPLFDRNQGEVARARAELELARLELEAARLAVEREVVQAHAALEAALEVVELAGGGALARVEENLELLELSLAEGQVGIVEVLLVQRELLAARREALEASRAVHRARARLDLAVGGEER